MPLVTADMDSMDQAGVARVKDLVTQLYTTMNLSEWQASRENELLQTMEKIKHELEPYEKVGFFFSFRSMCAWKVGKVITSAMSTVLITQTGQYCSYRLL